MPIPIVIMRTGDSIARASYNIYSLVPMRTHSYQSVLQVFCTCLEGYILFHMFYAMLSEKRRCAEQN